MSGGRHKTRFVDEWMPNVLVAVPQAKDGFALFDEVVDLVYGYTKMGCATVVVDTISAFAERQRDFSAEVGQYRRSATGGIRFGRSERAEVMPDQGDYRYGQVSAARLVQHLANIEANVVAVHHMAQAWARDEAAGLAKPLRGGPGTVGSAASSQLSAMYEAVIRLEQQTRLRGKDKPPVVEVHAQLVGDQEYAAKVREDGSVALPYKSQVPNSLREQREWWTALGPPAFTAVYGESGVGKTRLALSYPATPILYVALDARSERLPSAFAELKSAAVGAEGA